MATCTQNDIDNGTNQAKQRNDDLTAAGKPRIMYAAVSVTIEQFTADTIVLKTRGEDNNDHQYRIPLSQVWTGCPSTAKAAGDVGDLLISKQGLETKSNDLAKVRISGSTPDASGNTLLLIKWPDSGPVTKFTPLNIWPTSIVVKGYAIDDPEFHAGSVELLDGAVAGFYQAIQLTHGAEITLQLTDAGLGAFQMSGFDMVALQRAVDLVKSPFHDDARERAEAWKLIARCRKFLDWSQARGDGARHDIEVEIDTALSKLATL
jgi:hypothetical protein